VSYYAPEVSSLFESPPKIQGVEEIRKGQPAGWTSMPDVKAPISAIVAIGDDVFIEAVVTGTFKERMGHYEPTGKVVTRHVLSVTQWKNGKAIGDDTFGDATEFLAQIGALKLLAP
jgi:hypothetical protein